MNRYNDMLRNKTVLITGAAGGLGRAISLAFGKAGAKIIALDIDRKKLSDLKSELGKLNIESCFIFCDITNPESCKRSLKKGIEWKGGLDILINNAGITHRSAFHETDISVIEKVVRVNFFGSMYCTKFALGEIIKSRGSIVVISSVAGFAPLIARTGYSAGKHALHGFFESIRPELEGAGVHILVVCPSFIESGIDKNALGKDGMPALHRQITAGKKMKPETAAELIIKAVMNKKKFITVGTVAFLSYWVFKFIPCLYSRLMKNRFEKEMD